MSPVSSRPAPVSRAAWRDAWAVLRPHRRRLLVGFALLIVSRVAGLTLPLSSKFLVDEVVTRHRGALLAPLSAAIIGATVIQGLAALALSRILGIAAHRAIMDVRREIHARAMRLPVPFFDATRSGVLVSRIMTDPEALRNFMGGGLIQLAGSLLTAILALAALFWLNWRLTTMTLVLLGVFGGLMAFTFRRVRPLARQRAEIGSQVVGRLNEALGGIRVVKAYRAEEHEERVFDAGLRRLFAQITREITAGAQAGALAIVIFGCISAVLVFFGGREILAGSMTLGGFVTYVFFIGLLIAPVTRIADSSTQLSEAFASLDRIREFQDKPTEDQQDEGRPALPTVRGDVEFQEVAFEYSPGQPVLDGISFRAPAGSTTALVGPSGAGKSTVIGLVMGFYRPGRGRILVDGNDLALVRAADFRSHLGVVLQENFLFDGTIAENIAYARPSARHDEIVAAARVAHCDEFVEAMEKGYDTMVGERGLKLSGGQRQRVAIARAIVADPRILILDEATSSLDSHSEALVQDGLRSLRRGRTTFVIAHRLSTIHSADQILVLDGGRIVERGDHDGLMTAGGLYRQLYEFQFHGDGRARDLPSETPVEAEPAPAAVTAEPSLPVLGPLFRRRGGPGAL